MKVRSESEVAQSCLTLSDPIDCSPPGSSIHGIFQARVLEWGAIAFSDEARESNINNTNSYCLWRAYSMCDCIILSVTPCGLYCDCHLIAQQESVASQVALLAKNPPAYAGDVRDAGSIPGSGRSSGAGSGNSL